MTMPDKKLPSSTQLREARAAQARLSRLRFDPPQRMKNGRTLSHLPNEILSMIFDHLLPPSTRDFPEEEAKAIYDSLIPVCRFFRALFLPLRLRHLVIRSSAPRHVDFIRGIKDYPFPVHSLRTYVEKFTFHDWKISASANEGNDWVKSALLARYIPALSCFPNLCELKLTEVSITRAFFDAVAYLGNLSRVSISKCDFLDFEGAEDPYTIEPPSTPWTHFLFHDNTGFEDYLDALVVLIASPQLQILDSSHWSLTFALAEHKTVPLEGLQELATQIPCAPSQTFRDFLVRTPSIRILRITSLIIIGRGTYTPTSMAQLARQHVDIPRSALPNLSTVQCPEMLLGALAVVPERPISSVDLMCSLHAPNGEPMFYDPEELRLVLQETVTMLRTSPARASVTGIRHLAIGSTMFHDLVFDQVLAQVLAGVPLESLLIYVGSSAIQHEQDTLNSYNELPPNINPTVQKITLIVRGYAMSYDPNRVQCFLGEQARLCRWLTRGFPAAREISFCSAITWRLESDSQDQEREWRPDIVWCDRVRRGLEEVKDKIPLGRHATPLSLFTSLFPGQLYGDWRNLSRSYCYEGVTVAHAGSSEGEGGNVTSYEELQRALQWTL